MKLGLFPGCALTFAFALALVAGDEGANAMHRHIGFNSASTSPFQTERDLRGRAVGGPRGRKSKSEKHEDDNDDDDMHHDSKRKSKSDKRQDDNDGDDMIHHDSKSGKTSKRGPGPRSKGPSMKSGKSSKEEEKEKTPSTYYLAPFSCAKMCIDADGADFGTGELNKAISTCTIDDADTQHWMLHEQHDMIQVESLAYKGKCIGVNYEPGDRMKRVQEMCHDGILALLPCNDPATSWYFTGGQLLSFFCWSRGVSAKMSVSYDEDEEKYCHDELRTYNSGVGKNMSITQSNDFMFVTTQDMEMMNPPPISDTDYPTSEPTFYPSYSPTISPTYVPTASSPPSSV
ncbi:hypothetical protein ACHAXR_006039 [Thalassiosira sp. AJA248-18]